MLLLFQRGVGRRGGGMLLCHTFDGDTVTLGASVGFKQSM